MSIRSVRSHRRLLATLCTGAVALALALSGCGPTANAGPSAPSALTATAGPSSIALSWTDNSADETGFEVFRALVDPGTQQPGPWVSIATLPANTTAYLDGTVEPGAAYRYAVAATGAGAASAKATTAVDVSVAAGLDLVVGTLDFTPVFTQPQTAFLLYLAIPTADLPTSPVTVSLSGPPGWNGDAPDQFELSPDDVASGEVWGPRLIAFQPGTYTVSATIGGTPYSATASTTGAASLAPAQGSSIDHVGASSVDVSWQPVSGAGSYWVDIIDAPLRPDATRFGSANTTGTSVTVPASLAPGDYIALVFAATTDDLVTDVPGLKPASFAMSLAASSAYTVP